MRGMFWYLRELATMLSAMRRAGPCWDLETGDFTKEVFTMKVTEYLKSKILCSGKTHAQIAAHAGLASVNTVSMLKTGTLKLPLERIPALSEALGCDPGELLMIAMTEYSPTLASLLVDCLQCTALLSPVEVNFMLELRRWTKGCVPDLRDPQVAHAFKLASEYGQARPPMRRSGAVSVSCFLQP